MPSAFNPYYTPSPARPSTPTERAKTRMLDRLAARSQPDSTHLVYLLAHARRADYYIDVARDFHEIHRFALDNCDRQLHLFGTKQAARLRLVWCEAFSDEAQARQRCAEVRACLAAPAGGPVQPGLAGPRRVDDRLPVAVLRRRTGADALRPPRRLTAPGRPDRPRWVPSCSTPPPSAPLRSALMALKPASMALFCPSMPLRPASLPLGGAASALRPAASALQAPTLPRIGACMALRAAAPAARPATSALRGARVAASRAGDGAFLAIAAPSTGNDDPARGSVGPLTGNVAQQRGNAGGSSGKAGRGRRAPAPPLLAASGLPCRIAIPGRREHLRPGGGHAAVSRSGWRRLSLS
jgi:predicted GIY-YIG superfamily endonuclease